MNDTVSAPPSKAMSKGLNACKTLAEAFESKELKEKFAEALPGSAGLNADAMLRACVLAASKSPNIYKCDMRHALGAFMSLAFLGLVPNTVLQHAHLIPFGRYKGRGEARTLEGYDLTMIIGYPGYIELGHRSGFLRDVATGLIWPGDMFEEERGTSRYFKHVRNLDVDNTNKDPRAAYVFATFNGGGEEWDVMTWHEITRIRDRSQAYRTALAAKERATTSGWRLPLTWTEAPWVRDAHEMARKTVLRRGAKMWPKCPELRAGIGLEEAQERGGKLDYGAVIDGVATPYEGIPDVKDDPDPEDRNVVRTDARDPGAGFSDRRQAQPDPEDDPGPPDDDTPLVGDPVGPATVEAERGATSDFDAVLVDEHGEILGEYTDPAEFVKHFEEVWASSTNPEALSDNNMDALEDAQALGVQRKARMADDDPLFVTIGVPMKGSRQDWQAYRRAFAADLVRHSPQRLPQWLEAQRDILNGVPAAQRPLVIRDIEAEFGRHRIALPDWLVALKPRVRSTPEGAAEAEKPAQQTNVSGADELDEEQTDEQFAERLISRINTVSIDRPGVAKLDQLVTGMKVRSRVKTIGETNRPLWQRICDATDKQYARLSAYRT